MQESKWELRQAGREGVFFMQLATSLAADEFFILRKKKNSSLDYFLYFNNVLLGL